MSLSIYRLFQKWITVITIAFFLILPTISSAQNTIVVIPLGGEDNTPDPFKPLAANSPENTNYIGGHSASIIGDSFQTTLDKSTGLMWQRTDDNIERDWNAAFDYCDDLVITYAVSLGTFATLTNWRVPSRQELLSIVDHEAISPAINAAFPDTNSSYYWTASSFASNSAAAWLVDFDFGAIEGGFKTAGRYVRCVR